MGHHILVVEDEPEIADFLTRGLREEGFVVDHYAHGDLAWGAMRGGSWDLVLLDWWLPGQDGLSLLAKFREADRATPVLFLTARDAVSDRVRGLDSGADDYISKPFAFEELLARVRALLRRSEHGSGSVLRYADVSLDLASRRTERAGRAVDLTAKEQALLALFLRLPDETLSRARIYEDVWSERYDGVSNTLEVHVVELRRKLEAHGPRLIHTVRGRGYWFGAAPSPRRGEAP